MSVWISGKREKSVTHAGIQTGDRLSRILVTKKKKF